MENEAVQKKIVGRNFIFNFISQILTLIVPLVTTPYISRVLNEVYIGQYSYSLSIITYFILFGNLGFDLYGQRQIASYQDNKKEKSAIFWEITLLKLLFTSISLIALYSVLFSIGFGESYNKLILLLSIQVVSVPFDIQFLFRGEENFKSVAIRTMIAKLISLICIFVFVKTENDTWIYTLIVALSVFLSNIVMWPSIIKRIELIKFKELQFKRHIKPSILIFLPTLAVTIYSVFDKTMIGLLAKNPDYENGCYEQAYKLNSVMLLMVTIISSVLVSRNANEYKKNGVDGIRKNLYFATNYVWLIGTPLIVGNFILANNLSSWFLGEGYDEVPLLLIIMSIRFLVSGFSEIFGSQLFIAIGKEKYSLIASFSAALINVILNFILIPMIGAIGAAVATAVSEFLITFVLGIFVVKGKYISMSKMFKMSWKYILSAAIMLIPIYFMQVNMGYSIFTYILIVSVGALVYFIMLFLLRDDFLIRRALDVKKLITRRKLS